MKKKDKEEKKKLKLTKKAKIIFMCIIIIALVLLCYFKLLDHRIKSIIITGNNILSDQEVIDIANLSDYPNFYTTSSSSIKNKLIENSYIKDVKVNKKIFHEVDINITEHVPLFYYNDTQSVVFEDLSTADYKEGLNIPTLINYVPDTKYSIFANKFKDIDITIRNKISEIKYDPNNVDEDRFLLYMNDKNYVYITLTKMEILDKYNEAITKLDGKKGILYFDSGNYFEIK